MSWRVRAFAFTLLSLEITVVAVTPLMGASLAPIIFASEATSLSYGEGIVLMLTMRALFALRLLERGE